MTTEERAYGEWMLEQAEVAWTVFRTRAAELLATAPIWTLLTTSRTELLQQILRDATGFAGAEIIRRTIGLARVADLEEIADLPLRVHAERGALRAGRALLKRADSVDRFDQVLSSLRQAIEDSSIPGAIA